ncbi:Teneurin-2 [Myotis brandtii]|uniref:Teneurin-2 n=1 Tax=Myotis brandtii TaxID=109478 RepID=S7N0G2_MYOBR|nr:Teneurin-2 [Myotis brandtii]
MDVKDRRHRSLTRGRCGKECRYTSSSLDSEDCRVPTQKSYSSSETLKAYDHDSRMHYGNRVTDLVHRESDEFPRQGVKMDAYVHKSHLKASETMVEVRVAQGAGCVAAQSKPRLI